MHSNDFVSEVTRLSARVQPPDLRRPALLFHHRQEAKERLFALVCVLPAMERHRNIYIYSVPKALSILNG